MTTIDSAAARRAKTSLTLATFAALLASPLPGAGPDGTVHTRRAIPAGLNRSALPTPGERAAQASQVAIAPVIGAPEHIAREMQTAGSSMQSAADCVATLRVKRGGRYTLRGYIVAARETGRYQDFLHLGRDGPARATASTALRAKNSRLRCEPGPVGVRDAAGRHDIADKTAASLQLAADVRRPLLPLPSPANSRSCRADLVGCFTGVTTAADTASQVASARRAALGTTGSIDRGGALTAVVPSVTGAPGDGSVSLTRASSLS